jgi:signal transduction histidine kinase
MLEGQKLEGLGQLTSGVAHDFGNILQLLTNELELIRRRAPDEFTRQLLTFAKRQPLHFNTVDLNARVTDIVEMTRGWVGLMTLELALAADLRAIVTDANELDSAILNLIMNARDAMPDGKGTGLGLATVYGFVKQSGGNATLASRSGAGTTVSLILPKGAPSGLHGDAPAAPARILSLIRREAVD